MNGKWRRTELRSQSPNCECSEGAAIRVLSFLNETSQRHLASLANEKRKVTVIGEEHEPDFSVGNWSTSADIYPSMPDL